MTDKTDIAALREGLVELLNHVDSYGGKCWLFPEDVRSIIQSLGQLEAERQQREAAEATLNSLGYTHSPGASLWKPPLGKIPNFNLVDAYRNRAEAVEKEREGLQKALVIYGDEILELRSKLANPVVLPRTIWYEHDDLPREIPVLEKRLVIAGIKLAGFTVKGE